MPVGTFFMQNKGTVTQFEGDHIAHVSSELPSKERHTEFDIFITIDDEWILQGVGRTRVPGEVDRYWTVVSKDPADILQAIVGDNISRLSKKLIVETLNSLSECICD